MNEVAIVGSGPAGLSAALYTTRAGLYTVVYAGETRGGLPTTTERVDNYLGMLGIEGTSMAEIFLKHAEELGAVITNETVETITRNDDGRFTVVLTNGNERVFDSVIYAGGSTPRKLGILGEDLSGVSWCATCDGSFFRGDPVAVVGGGESAIEEAIYMSALASEVTVLVRGDSFRAPEAVSDQLYTKPNVKVLFNTQVKELKGDDEGLLETIVLSDDSELNVFGIFEAIGQVPQSHAASPHTTLLEDGFIKHSNVEGFFVAGDISNPEHRQIAVAVGDGAKAGIEAVRWLQKK